MTAFVIPADSWADRADAWERAVVHRARTTGPLPRYSSEAWFRLDPADPRRLAAVVAFARCWREHTDPRTIALELLDEIDDGRRALRHASWDVAGALDWRSLADSPSHAELRRRRGQVAT